MPDPGLRPQVVVAGYYGYGNIGDEAILRSLLADLGHERPDLRFVVLTGDIPKPPQSVPAAPAASAADGVPGTVEYVPRLQPRAVLAAMRRSQMLILGGGGLIQDVTSLRSLLYYLGLIWSAKRLGLPVAIYGGGIGPVQTGVGRVLARLVLPQVDLAALRDRRSIEAARALGVREERLVLTADPAFGLDGCGGQGGPDGVTVGESWSGDGDHILAGAAWAALARSGVPDSARGRLLGLALRQPMRREDEAAVADVLAQVAGRGQGLYPVLVPFHPEEDAAPLARLGLAAGVPHAVLAGVREPELLLAVVRQLRVVVAMRLHAVIFAVTAGVPCVALSYDPKVEALADDVPQIAYVPYPGIDREQLTAAVMTAAEAPPLLRSGLLAAAMVLRQRASGNAVRVAALLGRQDESPGGAGALPTP